MQKYRLLTTAELTELEPEFVKYLVLNGIDVDEWQRLKKEKPDEATRIVELFSDVVFEKIFRGAKYLKLEAERAIRLIKCNDEKMEMIAYNASAEIEAESEMYTGSKAYIKQREVEIFEHIQKGYQISDGEEYERLVRIINTK